MLQEGDQPPHPPHLSGQGVFFWLWPLFARAPRHWFLENFLLSAPGVQSVFFLLRSVGRRDLSAGPEQKKKHQPGFFFCSGPGERQGKEKPRWKPARGQSKKKSPPRVFFFFAAATAGPDRCVFLFAAAPPRPGWCFFLLWPRPDAHSLTVGWGDFGKARVVFFFCCGPAGSF